MSLASLGWPLGPTAPASVVTISTVLVALANWPAGRYAWWVESSAALHESVGPVAIVISLAGAWAGHEVARGDVLFRGASIGARPRQLARLVLTVAACGLAGLILGLAPRWSWTVRTATWGQPNLLDAAMTIAAIVSITAVSVVLGSLANRRAWCLAIAVGVAVAVWYAISISPNFVVLSPVWASAASPDYVANPAVIGYFVMFALTLTATSVMLFTAEGRGSRVIMVSLIVTTGILVIAPMWWRPEPYVIADPPPPICTQVAGSALCVHPANQPDIGRLRAAVRDVNGVLGRPISGRVTDKSLISDQPVGPGGVVVGSGAMYTSDDVRDDLVWQAAGDYQCPEGDVTPERERAGAISALLYDELGLRDRADEERLGSSADPELHRFERMSIAQFRAYYAQNRDRILTCSAPLPGSP